MFNGRNPATNEKRDLEQCSESVDFARWNRIERRPQQCEIRRVYVHIVHVCGGYITTFQFHTLLSALTVHFCVAVDQTETLKSIDHDSANEKGRKTAALLSLAVESGLFEPSQTEEIAQMLNRHFDKNAASPKIWLTLLDHPTTSGGGSGSGGGGEPELPNVIGKAHTAPERFAEGTCNLILLAIHPDHQKQGHGKALLDHVEQLLAKRGERVLLVETSGTDDFEYVRSFYRNSG
jgi:GNAT superfamily N-acetyltransferase